MADHVHDENCDHEEEGPASLGEALELDAQNQIYLQMRQQNIELLSIAIEMAGFGGQHPALKPNDLKSAMRAVNEILYEFYAWVDPEQSDDDDLDDEEEDDE